MASPFKVTETTWQQVIQMKVKEVICHSNISWSFLICDFLVSLNLYIYTKSHTQVGQAQKNKRNKINAR